MVVLSASVCTRQGKALFSRQFVEMNRLRVEGLLAAFPKLVGHSKQHTYVETDSVRYVYQPLENQMYLLLITTKASNIVEDLGTLRLLAKLVPDVAGGLQEHSIQEHAFDLIFAFDEVLTAGGYKEEVTLSAIRSNLIMDSHEEKIHMALKQTKEDQAKDEMRRKAKDIKDRQMAHMRQQFVQGGTATPMPAGMVGFGGGGPQASSWMDFNAGAQQPQVVQPQYGFEIAPPPVADVPKVLAKTGMKLGAGGKAGAGAKNNLMAAMAAEDNLFPLAPAGKNAFDLSAPAKPAVTPSTPVSLVLEEKINVTMNREGVVEACEVKGTLTLTANTDAGTMAVVQVNKASLAPNFNVATHPKVDKKMYESQGVLALKGDKGFPVGRPVGVLRWSYNGEDAAPITINCWPEDEGGSITVNIEMELTRKDLVLQDVNILLPLGSTETPVVENIDGVYKHDARSGMMCWHFDQIDASNSTGSLEFSIPGNDTDAFFPVQIGFRSETLLCPVQIASVTNSANGTPIPNQISQSFVPDSYQCA
ncbi:hypothetical protein MPSEU_000504600 [Mayamaea pseudoterrestris]|nr:hypothetical protein MPSEU_000504600 [Mayamaea pseudoterrestris]